MGRGLCSSVSLAVCCGCCRAVGSSVVFLVPPLSSWLPKRSCKRFCHCRCSPQKPKEKRGLILGLNLQNCELKGPHSAGADFLGDFLLSPPLMNRALAQWGNSSNCLQQGLSQSSTETLRVHGGVAVAVSSAPGQLKSTLIRFTKDHEWWEVPVTCTVAWL